MALLDFLTGGRQYRVTGAGGEDKVFKTQEAAQDYLRGGGYDTYTFRPLEGEEQRKLSTTRPRTTMSPRARPDGNRDRTANLRGAMERFADGGLLGLLAGGSRPQPVYGYAGSRVAEGAPMATYSAPPPVSDVTMPAAATGAPAGAPAGAEFYFGPRSGLLSISMIDELGLRGAAPGSQMTKEDFLTLREGDFYGRGLEPQIAPQPAVPTNVTDYGDPLGKEVSQVDEVFNRMRANPLFSEYGDEFLRRLAEQVDQ